jgi:hypothetical protein
MAIVRTTGFDPAVHGFHFRNRFSGLDIVHGINIGLGSVASLVSEDADFWDGWGLCGGMTWGALDHFYSYRPIPASRQAPEADTALLGELVDRQIDSCLGAALVTKCLRWQSRSEHNRWWDPRATTWRLTRKEWLRTKQSIDHGDPASLTLIRTQRDLSKNHQVLAVGYCEDASGKAVIDLYDPNHPDDTPKIVIRLNGPEAGRAIQTTGEPLRGFFVWPYRPDQRPNVPRAETGATAADLD